jgi:type I restriction enzyme R subunit
LPAVRELSQAFALAVPHPDALSIGDDVAFVQAVQAVLAKRAPGDVRPEDDLDHAVRQIISRAVAPESVVDIFGAAGIRKPDISILSEEFLAEMRGMPQRNLAVKCCGSCFRGSCARADARTWCRRALSPRCWSKPSVVTRIERSRQRR